MTVEVIRKLVHILFLGKNCGNLMQKKTIWDLKHIKIVIPMNLLHKDH